jgi:hypothetical protein
MGMEKRAQRGLPTTSHIPLSHKLKRNAETGRAEKFVVNEDMRWLWDLLAELILEGVSWRNMEVELYQRYGYANKHGKVHNRHKFHKLVTSPTFWGHSARKYRGVGYKKKGAEPDKDSDPRKWRDGLWAIEPGHEVPKGVTIYYNTHEAVWTGELAERIKAEIRRRAATVKGKAKAHTKYWPTGLFVCGVCGSNLNIHFASGRRNYYLRCVQRFSSVPGREKCTNTAYLSERFLRDWMSHFLRFMAVPHDYEAFRGWLMGDQAHEESFKSQIAALEHEEEHITGIVAQLILNEASAGESVKAVYTDQIAKKDSDLSAIRRRLEELRRQDTSRENEARRLAYDDIMATIDRFWERPAAEINQTLHALFGSRKPVFLDGQLNPTGFQSLWPLSDEFKKKH